MESVQRATLKRALELAGDMFELALHLGPSATSLSAMIRGEEAIPTWVFLRAADYINDQQDPSRNQQESFEHNSLGWRRTPQ